MSQVELLLVDEVIIVASRVIIVEVELLLVDEVIIGCDRVIIVASAVIIGR